MIKKFLNNKYGSINLSYAIILSVACILGIAAISFMKNIEEFQRKSSTNIETQNMVSPSLSVS